MGSSPSVPADKHVVIVGAGYAGTVAGMKLLQSGAKFTIINATDAFHHNVAAVRATCVKDFSKKTLIPLKDTFGDHFKQGKVIDINVKLKKVVLESGEEINYDVLIIATGTTGNFPNKVNVPSSEAVQLYDQIVEKVEKCENIAIIGGGPSGTEIAAEIASLYPNKSITLVHSSNCLIHPKCTETFQRRLRGILERMKIKLVLGEKVTNLDDAPEDGPFTLITDKGTEVQADYIFKCTGLKTNSAAYQNALATAMQENGQLKVNEFFEVEGFEDVYAIGDSTNLPEPKMALYAGRHGELLISNLGKKFSAKGISPYKPANAPVLMVVSLGPKSGLGQTMGGSVIGEFLCAKLKSGSLFVDKYWKEMKQKPPTS